MAVEIVPQFGVRGMERVVIGKESVPALLVRPDTDLPRPAALMQHGWTSCKEDFLPLALLLATYGFVSLLPDAGVTASGYQRRAQVGRPSAPPTTSSTWCATRALICARSWSGSPGSPTLDPTRWWRVASPMGAIAALITGTEDERVAAVVSVSGSPLPDLANVTMLGTNAPSAVNQQWSREHDAAANIAQGPQSRC